MLITRKRIFIVFVIMSTFQSKAFDWNKCKSQSIYQHSFGVITNTTTSSSQFVSSWGGCSMIGEASHDKKVFLAINLEQLQIDSARGEGEYFDAYASLARCDGQAAKQLPSVMQKSFSRVFGEDLSYGPEQVYERIEEIIQNDGILSSGCGKKT